MKENDFQRLVRIKRYCNEIESARRRFGDSFEVFANDRDYQDAVCMKILQIGELSIGLTKEFVERTSSQIEWRKISGIRNVFAHEYKKIDVATVWETVIKDIPKLARFCETALPSTKPLIITIDGPAGAGKSTVSKKVAARFGLNFLDTGALYRALSFALDEKGVPPTTGELLENSLCELDVRLSDGRVFVNDRDVSVEIRTPQVDKIVSPYSACPQVRARLLGLQRRQGEFGAGLVAEGRDVGSVVFPNADVKIFLTASPEERARRRYKERIDKGESANLEEILAGVIERDRIDSTREVAPLKKPDGAHVVDSSNMNEEEVIEAIISIAKGL